MKSKNTNKIEGELADLIIELHLKLDELKDLDEAKYNEWQKCNPDIQKYIYDKANETEESEDLYIPLNNLEIIGLATTLQRLVDGSVNVLKIGNLNLIYKEENLQAYTIDQLNGSDNDIDDSEEDE